MNADNLLFIFIIALIALSIYGVLTAPKLSDKEFKDMFDNEDF